MHFSLNLRCVVISVLLLFLISCQQNTSPVKSQPALQITPSSGVIGTPLKLTGMDFDSTLWNNLISFPNLSAPLHPDSGNSDTLFTYVPLGTGSGYISVNSGGSQSDSIRFQLTESTPDSVKVMWSNLPQSINQKDSQQQGWDGTLNSWQANRQDSLITLTRLTSCGDECTQTVTLQFRISATDDLPQFVRLIYENSDSFEGIARDTLSTGLIKLRSFQVGGLISGWIFTPVEEPWMYIDPVIFWYDFGEVD